MKMGKTGGLILAAGLSSRMGDYKQLMKIKDRSMVGCVVDMMKDAGAEIIVVVTGYRHEELEASLKNDRVEFVFNPDYATTQQLDSVKLGLSALKDRCDRIIISPADIPMVKAETVKKLLKLKGDVIRPVYYGEPGHPIIFNAEKCLHIMNYNGPEGLRGAIERSDFSITELDVEDRGVVIDNDTKQDFERMLIWYSEKETITC